MEQQSFRMAASQESLQHSMMSVGARPSSSSSTPIQNREVERRSFLMGASQESRQHLNWLMEVLHLTLWEVSQGHPSTQTQNKEVVQQNFLMAASLENHQHPTTLVEAHQLK